MRFQRSIWSCGPTACVNAGLALGVTLDYRRAVEASGARTAGASEDGLLQALRHPGGLSARPFTSDNRNEAWAWLRGELIGGRAVVLCLDSWSHWACVVGLIGDRVILVDSSRSKRNKRENGVHSVSHVSLMRRWWNARRWADGERRLYAICVGK